MSHSWFFAPSLRQDLPQWESYYGILRTAFMANERYGTLSNTTLTALENLLPATHLQLRHRINSLLQGYGRGNSNYIEPVMEGEPTEKTQLVRNNPVKSLASFTVFPNPAKDYIEIRWNWFELGLEQEIQIQLLTLTGQPFVTRFVSDYRKNITLLFIANVPSGLYIVRITNAKGDELHMGKVTITK